MTNQWMTSASAAALMVGLLFCAAACAEAADAPNLFTTENFRNDRAL